VPTEEELKRQRRERLKAWQEAQFKKQSNSAELETETVIDEKIKVLEVETSQSVAAMDRVEETLRTRELQRERERQQHLLERVNDTDLNHGEREDVAEGEFATEHTIEVQVDVFSKSMDEMEREARWMLSEEDDDDQHNSAVQAIKSEDELRRDREAEEEEEEALRQLREKQHAKDKDSSEAEAVFARQQMTAQDLHATDEDQDPLDAFMSSLMSSGQVAVQKPLNEKSDSINNDTVAPTSRSITLEEILAQGKRADEIKPVDSDEEIEVQSGKFTQRQTPVGRRGWESETEKEGGSESEDDGNNDKLDGLEESDEARELREHREFLEALRKAREEEDLARGRLLSLESEQQQQQQSFAKNNQGLGRLFAGEGDMVEEREVEEKRRSALDLLEEAKRGKTLREVDHSRIQYLSIRKNLYIVPKVLAKLSDEDVTELRSSLAIKVRGRGCPCPVSSFAQCGLSDKTLSVLDALHIKTPFPIQRQAIPAIMAGRDVLAVARTGSGKTLAFVLPMLRHVADQPSLKDGDGPIGMVLAPARELALQTHAVCKKFCRILSLSAACLYGGGSVAEQIAELKRGAEIAICTPGRLIDVLAMQTGRLVSLQRTSFVVLDEADRMLDMGFEPQIKMILNNVRPDRQTLLFSATFPKQIEKLARSLLRLPLEVVVGERSTVSADIEQIVEVHEEEDKFLRLLQLLGLYYEKGSVLIFVDRQEKADQLFGELLRLGYPCLSLHGGKEQADRDAALHEFKTGIKTVCVATSVAGRGLDVPAICCVINYNAPNHLEDYVHRVGRTGRAGRKVLRFACCVVYIFIFEFSWSVGW
jgi:ATP-dependent RNA helicase DDX46/PRP5